MNSNIPQGPYPDNNPKTAAGAKKIPLETVPPTAEHCLALAFADGARKYGAFNWRNFMISSTVYYGATQRHLKAWFDGEDLAPDSNVHHIDHAMACLAMLRDAMLIGKLNDNRPPKGGSGAMQSQWLADHQASPDNVPKLPPCPPGGVVAIPGGIGPYPSSGAARVGGVEFTSGCPGCGVASGELHKPGCWRIQPGV